MSDIRNNEFTIGSEVVCNDGICGELRRVVVDPVSRSLTHLVVEAKHREGLGRLVPINLVSSTGEQIQLQCNLSKFETLERQLRRHSTFQVREDSGVTGKTRCSRSRITDLAWGPWA